MNVRSLANALGGTACGNTILAPGPGHSARDRSLSIKVDPAGPDGFVVHSFAGDNPLASRDYVRQRARLERLSGSRPARPEHPPHVSREAGETGRRELAFTIWCEAIAPLGTPVETYLASRSLALTVNVLAADVLRFHPRCPFRRIRLPAMIALMRDIVTDEPRAIHRTALRLDGSGKPDMPDGSSPKQMLGPAAGAAVKLTGDESVTTGLGIAEGIENALTAICAGWGPVWACGSAGAVKAFSILSGVEVLTIFADPEPTGREAARTCAQRWADAGREATIILPPDDDSDWNDIGRAIA